MNLATSRLILKAYCYWLVGFVLGREGVLIDLFWNVLIESGQTSASSFMPAFAFSGIQDTVAFNMFFA